MAGEPAGRERAPGTRVVHAGLPPAEPGTPFLGGPVFAAPFHLPGDPKQTRYGYSRYANPTWSAYEDAIGELEGGSALVFPSGMAACSAVLLPVLEPGDVLVAPSDGYPVLRALAAGHLAARGVETRLVPTAGDWLAARRGARVGRLQSPSHPGLDVCCIAAIPSAAP